MSHGHRFPADEWPRLVSDRRRSLAPPEAYVARFDWSGVTRAADLGAGPGFFTEALLAALPPAGQLLSIDVEPRMLSVLAERVGPNPRHRHLAASADSLPLPDGSLDAAWCACVAQGLPSLDRAWAEAHRVLRPGGRLYVVDWEPVETDHGPPVSERIGAELAARAMETAGFRVDPKVAVTCSHWGLVGRR